MQERSMMTYTMGPSDNSASLGRRTYRQLNHFVVKYYGGEIFSQGLLIIQV